jgi:hypothetical protein
VVPSSDPAENKKNGGMTSENHRLRAKQKPSNHRRFLFNR